MTFWFVHKTRYNNTKVPQCQLNSKFRQPTHHSFQDEFSPDIFWLSKRPGVCPIEGDVSENTGGVVRHFDPVALRIQKIAEKREDDGEDNYDDYYYNDDGYDGDHNGDNEYENQYEDNEVDDDGRQWPVTSIGLCSYTETADAAEDRFVEDENTHCPPSGP